MEIYIPLPRGRQLCIELGGEELLAIDVFEPPIFRGAASTLSADLEELDGYLKYRNRTGRQRVIPAGTSFLELHFLPFTTFLGKEREPRNFAEKVQAMQAIPTDFAQLIQNLSDPSYLEEVKFLYGTTNPRMAHFAINRFGFREATCQKGSFEYLDQQDRPGSIPVLALRNEIIQNHSSDKWRRIVKAVNSRNLN